VNVGRVRQKAFYYHVNLASNYRLAEWMGAVLRIQLRRLEEQSERRAANAAYLAEALQEVPGLIPVPGDPRVTRNAYHLFRLWYEPEAFGGHSREDFIRAMEAEGIPMRAGYPEPLSRQAVIVERSAFIREKLGLPAAEPDPCPVCEDICRRGLWLYQAVLLAERQDLDDIVTAAAKIQRAWGA